MDIFPALAPTTRVFNIGNVPTILNTSLGGTNVGFRRGNRRVGQRLDLTFSHLTQAQMDLIKTHYFSANGTYDIFYLSEEIWGDYTTPPVPLLSDYAWRYIDLPTITDVSFDRFTVEVSLQTEPIDTGDLIMDAGSASVSPARTYILDAGSASASPARDYVISPGGAL